MDAPQPPHDGPTLAPRPSPAWILVRLAIFVPLALWGGYVLLWSASYLANREWVESSFAFLLGLVLLATGFSALLLPSTRRRPTAVLESPTGDSLS